MSQYALALAAFEKRLSTLRTRYERGMGALETLEARLEEATNRRDKLNADLVQWDLERLLLSKVSEVARLRMKDHIEATVTAALQAVLDREDMRFEVRLSERAGQPVADWLVVSTFGDEEIAADPEDGRGGGVLDIVSLALRMAVLELSQPRLEGPLLVDEPGKHVSSEYVENLAHFLRDYAARTGRQVLMVTHQQAVADVAHKAYRFELVNGVTEVAEA